MRTAGIALLLLLGACKDQGKASSDAARDDVAKLVALTEKDVAEVEHGLPEGARKLDALLSKELGKDDPRTNVPAVRSSLLKMRQQVPDLGIAKSTFFAFTDPKGVAIRNDSEQDTLAGKDLVGRWPGLAPARDTGAFASTVSSAADGTPLDKDWVAAVPVKKTDGSLGGLLVTGWPFRRFAYHLQATLQREVQDALMRGPTKGKMPILYVCIFDRESKVYCASSPGAVPVPVVNETALAGVGLWAKTEAGPASSPLKVTDRDFGWAAARTPKLSPDVGVVVLRSEM